MSQSIKKWFDTGVPWIWLNAGAVSASVIMVSGLILLISVKALSHFWPAQLIAFDYLESDGSVSRYLGEITDEEITTAIRADLTELAGGPEVPVTRYLVKTGNRDISGLDFRWVASLRIQRSSHPENAMVVERREWGNFYGYPAAIKSNGETVSIGDSLWQDLQQRLERSNQLIEEINFIEKDLIGAINYKMERIRLKERGYELENITDPAKFRELEQQEAQLQDEYNELTERLDTLYEQARRDSLVATVVDGKEVEIPLAQVVRAFRPNAMSLTDKFGFYFMKMWEFVSEEPREANTEGGIFPAIFGTVMMVLIMSVMVTPFGVVAAVYLSEYAKQGVITRTIRIAVNNLAGVPSIVYGVFGLGFFVYFLGGSIDQLFFPEALPAPTFGTPGILWASLTLAILTVPVVIVATEEGLSRVPREIREGSLALGATKAETLWRTVLPMTAPAMMTGLILAVARAAGEVAPLMLVGVVKLAPSLPLDGNFPFLHLDRKFMHLGFHIYDVGFQSPNVEAARPLVYATAFLLVLIIIILNLTAMRIRNRLREKYRAAEQ